MVQQHFFTLLLALVFTFESSLSNNLQVPMLPTLFLAHGGGPMPLLDMKTHGDLSRFLSELPTKYISRKPKQIILISAHWESASSTSIQISTGNENKSLLYDYYGFPPESYAPHLTYKAEGALDLSSLVLKELSASFQNVELVSRGFDHGVFIPLKLMYPDADIPILQISLLKGLNPIDHIKLGKILSKIRESNEDVLIIGSGMSFHNMNAFAGFGGDKTAMQKSLAFHTYLKDAIENPDTSIIHKSLIDWEKAPHARYCHPREEHLIPLHVAFGAAGENAKGKTIYDSELMGAKVGSFLFE
jgi:4,5-DOPA dioxygenase extradiol